MSRSSYLQTLRAFVDIRSAQKRAARAGLAEAQRTLSRAEARLDAERELQAGRLESWAAAMSTARLDLQLSLAWGWALMDGETAVDLAARSAERAGHLRDVAREGALVAEARHGVAENLTANAARDVRRRADEAAITSAEDRFSWRRAAP